MGTETGSGEHDDLSIAILLYLSIHISFQKQIWASLASTQSTFVPDCQTRSVLLCRMSLVMDYS